ncbi:MAG TPA: glycosyltransferase family 2 protein [Steroidobacteraceae bacterium]|nr:glycosyltransferase family 2 protein [Steroidobacteraceae bacterium]
MTKLSAVIISYNEADRIGECVRRASFCDEVLVVDSHSSDGTREIAAAAGARVIDRDWPGFRSQKEFALRAAKHDWVLSLDADEFVSPALRNEIETLRADGFPMFAGWNMPRQLEYFGKYLRYGLTYPDRHLRLVDRRRGGWRGREVHEYLDVEGNIGRLRCDLHHHAYRGLSHQVSKLERYAELMAKELHGAGKSAGMGKILLRPLWRFVSGYIFRLGFLDGWRGLVLSLIEANYVRQKYLKLFLLKRGQPL